MPTVKLTERLIKEAQLAVGCHKLDLFDTDCIGLLVEVRAKRKTYYLRFLDEFGKRRQKSLGRADVLTLSDARQLARAKLRQLYLGSNPFTEAAQQKSIPTFNEFVQTSFIPFIKSYKKDWRGDIGLLNNHILPVIGQLSLSKITRGHMLDLFSNHRLTHKAGTSNRVIVLCRYIFNCALKWETEGLLKNPTSNIPLYPENNRRERFLTTEESAELFRALERSENPQLKYIVAMLLLTGARKTEVLTARWSQIDINRRIWTIPYNKTGKPRHVPISDGLLMLLDQIPRIDCCDHLLPNLKTLKPYKSIHRAWDVARKRAGLADVRIHDLRHSFASFLINSGCGLYEVQRILGHKQVTTTQRYAHLSQDSLVLAANTAMSAVPIINSPQAPDRRFQYNVKQSTN